MIRIFATVKFDRRSFIGSMTVNSGICTKIRLIFSAMNCFLDVDGSPSLLRTISGPNDNEFVVVYFV